MCANKVNCKISELICPGCGNIIPIPRKPGRSRPKNHIKDFYCPYCNCVQKMTEVRNNDFIYPTMHTINQWR